ncbi:MAG: UDP-N-acetylmuramoyl-L-alanyl-D-glutamate--2,6-diaminopimelate ligase [bacterium]|nr:UDP-N-acetylmuramoyl-L-alanyl-D-glutamate--2,6-diaminopimelate ligase [bacterium]
MLNKLKSFFSATNPIRLLWHRLKAFLACVFYRYPSNQLVVIGITGTNGKTTTVTLTAKILEKAGYKVGMASTVGFKIDRKEWQNTTHKTTLGPFQIQKLLRDMVRTGCRYAVIETSSHALSQHRIAGISYDVACITNVTPEHLDYHRSMKAYRMDKMKLFENLSKGTRKKGVPKISIHNADDRENFDAFMKFKADKKIAYGRAITEAAGVETQVRADDIQLHAEYTDLNLISPQQQLKIRSYLPGDFNVENILAATAIAYSQGVDLKHVKAACQDVRLIPGRLESIKEGQDFQVIVDFAMTEDGYEKLLNSLRKLTEHNLWVVFGCCGDRDRKKRPKIGEICGKLADKVVVCDDEPYTEDPKKIRDMILEGLDNTRMKRDTDYFEIPERAEAIEFAIRHAKPGDTIVVPGMGDLEGRTFAEGIRPWNEREEIRKILKKLQEQATSTV